jgi:hypothetical protein
MGGTDDPSNLIKLTVEEHAEAHRKLYEEHGKVEDKLAWQGLAGIIPRQEIVKRASAQGGKTSNKNRLEAGTHLWQNSEHQKQKAMKRIKDGTHNFFDPEVRAKQKIAHAKTLKEKNPVWNQIAKGTNKFISDNPINRKVECPHCNKIGPYPQMKRWHFENCKANNVEH